MNILRFRPEAVARQKGTRFLWQYNDKSMTEFRQEKLKWLRKQMHQISPCWTLKEQAIIFGLSPGVKNTGMAGCGVYHSRLTVRYR